MKIKRRHMDWLIKELLGRQLSIRERIFSMLMIVGGIMSVGGLVETVIVSGWGPPMIPLLCLFVTILISLFLCVVKKQRDLAAVVIGLVLCLAVFPSMFFYNGGIKGGATVWLVINLIYAFLTFSGKRLVFFCTLSCVVQGIMYYAGYHGIVPVVAFESTIEAYMDSAFSVLVVGFAMGAMIKFQIRAYEAEREIVRKQTEELEEASRTKERFFASMSHEIRTPINTMIGLNEMILRESQDETAREYAANVKSAGTLLLGIVNDIIDHSQMQLNKMEIIDNEYNTADLFRECINVVSVLAKEKNLELFINIHENIPKILKGDKKRIQQILINLLTNAVKYTKKGSVSFYAKIDSMEETEVSLSFGVEDTGIGIKKEELENLYDAFKRLDSRNNMAIQGSGLGLTIAKSLVNLMGGKIHVDSIYEKGSIFTVELKQVVVDPSPVGKQEQYYKSNAADESRRKIFEAPEARVLVVDDSLMNLNVIRQLLKRTKVQVDTAMGGSECLQKTKQHFYHVILLDHMMPEMDGVETIGRIRTQSNGLCRETNIIALTANYGSDMQKVYQEAGFDGLIEKPVQGAFLEETVLAYLPEEIVEYQNKEETKETVTNIRKRIRKRKKKVMISTDCLADLPEEMLKKYDIQVIYMYIRTQTGRYVDTLEIDSGHAQRFITDKNSYAQVEIVSVDEYEAFFASQLERAEEVIHIAVVANTGKSYGVAVEAAKRFDHVHVVDSKQISCGQGLLVLQAAERVKQGADTETVLQDIYDMRERIESCFIMPTTRIFSERGYVKHGVVNVSEFFRLKPILKVKKSRLRLAGFCQGGDNKEKIRFLRRQFRGRKSIDTETLFVSHVGLAAEELAYLNHAILKKVPFNKIYVHKASLCGACNSGVGTYGIAYMRNEE